MFYTKIELLTLKMVLKLSLFQTFYRRRLLRSLEIYKSKRIVDSDRT